MEPIRDPEGVEIEYLKRTGAIQDHHLLEIGCGNGRLTRRYAGFSASAAGVDPDFDRLAESVETDTETKGRQIPFIQATAEMLPFADEAFESAIFGWSL